ncbi:MAG: ferritin-like domain-containing protein [Myxococcota bacterium]
MNNPYHPPIERSPHISPWALVFASLAAGIGGPLAGFALIATPSADNLALFLIFAGPAFAVLAGVASVVPALLNWRSKLAIAGGLTGLLSAALFGTTAFGLLLVFARGRQLRQSGQLVLPPVGSGGAWAAPTDEIVLPPEVRSAVAAAWRENGRTEHASVAAFARLGLELVAVGAPPELLIDAARDGVDEIRHTEATFGLARAIDGRALSPAPFPAASTAGALHGDREARLAELASTSLVDGVLHEGVSARVIAALVERCEVPAITRVLRSLADDEERHAAHAWDVVVFCLNQGGEPVRRALVAAAAAIPPEIRSSLPESAHDGAWERYGLPGRALEQAQYTATFVALRERLASLLRSEAA